MIFGVVDQVGEIVGSNIHVDDILRLCTTVTGSNMHNIN